MLPSGIPIMKNLPISLATVLLCISCNTSAPPQMPPVEKIDSVSSVVVDSSYYNMMHDTDTTDTTGTDDMYATCYLVVADTGNNYTLLRKKMAGLQRSLQLEIDTMGRYYNEQKHRIVLPDSSDDEMYAGEYFPRRYASEALSLEQMDFYLSSSDVQNMGLITGIYASRPGADSALTRVKQMERNAFVLKTKIYMGCMH